MFTSSSSSSRSGIVLGRHKSANLGLHSIALQSKNWSQSEVGVNYKYFEQEVTF